MLSVLSITPSGDFDLRASLRFSEGWEPAAIVPSAGGAPVLRLAFAVDGWDGHAAVALTQDADGVVHGELAGTGDPAVAWRQALRIVALDADGRGYAAVGERDAVVGGLQARFPGLRPVSFHSPYEAAAWAVLNARMPAARARAVRDALAREHGAVLDVAGEALAAFPLPEALLAVREPPRGVPEEKLRRLHAVAEAALAGRLDADALLARPRDEALTALEEIRGIGPFSARLILIRGSGATDVAATEEPRVRARIAELYGADADPGAVADGWRPFRTWVSVLLRSSAR